jgi:1-acyl-sn-glycerol-3-phosphate acyltransferase
VILEAIERVKSGISICIFPEGTRNKNQEDPLSLLPFKEGSFKIATKTGCRIVPMAITGSADVFENHFPWIHKGTITITYGAPIDPKALDKETQKKLGAYCQKAVEDLLREAVKKAE